MSGLNKSPENINAPFLQNFEIVTADTAALIDEAHKLRYQVYCEEKGYEDARCYPDGREYDEYDSRSVHSLIQHRESGIYVGVVRLILPERGGQHIPLPMERHCRLDLAKTHPRLVSLPRENVGEISRFSVSKIFRRRITEQGLIYGVSGDGDEVHPQFDRRLLPHITLGLIAAFIRMCAKHDIHYCYAVMEPTLLRFLSRFGIQFSTLGEAVDYRGLRVPAFIAAGNLETVRRTRADLWELIGAEVLSSFNERCGLVFDAA
jgi:N-acyl amino acid synthase of PEP-CTERM/exosortase system